MADVKVTKKVLESKLKKEVIHKKGDILEIMLEDSFFLDYHGSDFSSENEIKKVQVIAPGLKLQGTLVARPVVLEVK